MNCGVWRVEMLRSFYRSLLIASISPHRRPFMGRSISCASLSGLSYWIDDVKTYTVCIVDRYNLANYYTASGIRYSFLVDFLPLTRSVVTSMIYWSWYLGGSRFPVLSSAFWTAYEYTYNSRLSVDIEWTIPALSPPPFCCLYWSACIIHI